MTHSCRIEVARCSCDRWLASYICLGIRLARLPVAVAALFIIAYNTSNAQPFTESETRGAANLLRRAINGIAAKEYPSSSSTTVLRRVSIRLTYCSIAYNLLGSKDPSLDDDARRRFSLNAALYKMVGVAIHPDSVDDFKRQVDEEGREFRRIQQDKRALFYFLRNCQSFSEPALLSGAIRELML
jgi:hypothetical protein